LGWIGDFVARGENDEQVMTKVAEHARKDHECGLSRRHRGEGEGSDTRRIAHHHHVDPVEALLKEPQNVDIAVHGYGWRRYPQPRTQEVS
jgi:hypothetical protein